jgi:hypothetical protein
MTAAERNEVSGVASFRIVPRRQKPTFEVTALSRLVPSGSDTGVDAGGCYARRATAMRACKSPRIGLRASTSACPAITESWAAGAPATAPGRRRPGDAHLWRISGAESCRD